MNKAAEDFFANLPSEKEAEGENFDMFQEAAPEKDKTPEPVEEVKEEPQEEEHIENDRKKPLRSERRAEKQTQYALKALQEEREARIRLEEQVKALADTKPKEIDPDIKKLLVGGITPEEGAAIFESALSKAKREAREEALAAFREVQAEGDSEINEMAETIQERIESIEDRYGVDLTNDSDTRNKFLDFVESIAPEDSDELPNMSTAWRLFQQTQKAPPAQVERKAAISSRGMTRSVKPIPEGQNLKPMTFDNLNRSRWWDKIRGLN